MDYIYIVVNRRERKNIYVGEFQNVAVTIYEEEQKKGEDCTVEIWKNGVIFKDHWKPECEKFEEVEEHPLVTVQRIIDETLKSRKVGPADIILPLRD